MNESSSGSEESSVQEWQFMNLDEGLMMTDIAIDNFNELLRHGYKESRALDLVGNAYRVRMLGDFVMLRQRLKNLEGHAEAA